MQLDAEENEDVFYKPPVEPAARSPIRNSSDETAASSQATGEEED